MIIRTLLIALCVVGAAAFASAQQPGAPQVTYVDATKVTELFAKPGALADIFYIVDGSATFVTGGTMVGGKETRPNQMLGTDITGGHTHQLKKGDFISIPAGIPHWFKDVPATGVTYYMVKVVKP
jgi:mannose-6-phosphate isomerase-like protein (cupin superfamily)